MIELSSKFLKTSTMGNRNVEINTDDPEKNETIIKQLAKKHDLRRMAAVSYYKGKKRYTCFIISFNKIKDKEDFVKELKLD